MRFKLIGRPSKYCQRSIITRAFDELLFMTYPFKDSSSSSEATGANSVSPVASHSFRAMEWQIFTGENCWCTGFRLKDKSSNSRQLDNVPMIRRAPYREGNWRKGYMA